MAYKKPKIGQNVYCVYYYSILLKQANWLGEDSFIVDYSNFYCDDSKRWFYDEYNINWTTNFNKAKALLRKKYNIKKITLVENRDHDYWEIA